MLNVVKQEGKMSRIYSKDCYEIIKETELGKLLQNGCKCKHHESYLTLIKNLNQEIDELLAKLKT